MDEHQRLKELRCALHIRQGDFAERISTTQGHISDIENGRKHLSERTLRLICLESWDGKKVNERWLREGVGELFLKIPDEDETAALFYELLEDETNELYRFVKEIIRTYKELSPSSQKIIKEASGKLLENLSKNKKA